MGDYAVPEQIREYKPKGTVVKKIAGHFYVYEYTKEKTADGKWRNKTGKMIGTIVEGRGYIPNDNLLCDAEISTVEFGDYAISLANSTKTLSLLESCFNKGDAIRIYAIALIHFTQGFMHMKDIGTCYEMSYLSLLWPGLKMGYDALEKLYDQLGRRQGGVLKLEEQLLQASSGEVAIDGHVIGSGSTENDLTEKGYKFWKLGEAQMNLLMAYDVNTGMPLLSRMYEGGSTDGVSVKDLFRQVKPEKMLFIVDRGFYSTENLELFTRDGNAYIIPLRKNHKACQQAVSRLDMPIRFVYQKGRKGSLVECKDERIDGQRILTFRDVDEAAAEQTNYLRHIGNGDRSYTKEVFDQLKDYMGVIVLQTSISDKSPQEIYILYKKRWQIETFYNYFKNRLGCRSLGQQDYYKTQGLAFLMLVEALIHHEFEEAARAVQGFSVQDCLLQARMVKADKRYGSWCVANCIPRQQKLFKKLNTPLTVSLNALVT